MKYLILLLLATSAYAITWGDSIVCSPYCVVVNDATPDGELMTGIGYKANSINVEFIQAAMNYVWVPQFVEKNWRVWYKDDRVNVAIEVDGKWVVPVVIIKLVQEPQTKE